MLDFAINTGRLIFLFLSTKFMSVLNLFEGLVIDSHFISVDGVRDTSDSKCMTSYLMSEIKVNVENAK